jgi:hypothetical protein
MPGEDERSMFGLTRRAFKGYVVRVEGEGLPFDFLIGDPNAKGYYEERPGLIGLEDNQDGILKDRTRRPSISFHCNSLGLEIEGG